MADATAQAKATRRQGAWRHRENRASPKYLAKRVSEEDHEAVTRYAEDHGVKIAELLAPSVKDIIQRAHDYCDQLDEKLPASAKAS